MGLLCNYDELEKQSEKGLIIHYLNNLPDQDIPALYQAWFDIFTVGFEDLKYDEKIIYFEILKEVIPESTLIILNHSAPFVSIRSNMVLYYIDAIKEEIEKYILYYIMTHDCKDIVDLVYNGKPWEGKDFMHTLLCFNHENSRILEIGRFRKKYIYVDEGDIYAFYSGNDTQNTQFGRKIESRYDEIKHQIERLISIKKENQ